MSDLKSRCAWSRKWLLPAVATIAVGAVAGCSSESPQLPAAPAVAGGAPPPAPGAGPPAPGSFVPSVPVAGGPPAPGSAAPSPIAPTNDVATTPGVVPGPAATVPGAPLTPGGITGVGGTAPLAPGAEPIADGPPPKNAPLAIKAPEAILPASNVKAGKTKIEFPASCSVLLPLQPSRFLAIGHLTSSPRVGIQIWDHSKMAIAHEFRSPLTNSIFKCALSPDGAHLAVIGLEDQRARVHVFSCDSKLKLHEFEPYPGTGVAAPEFLSFAGPGRLVMCQSGVGTGCFKVWDIATERFVTVIPVKRSSNTNAVAVSPDGRYVAHYGEQGAERAIRVYDLDTGGLAAEAHMPFNAPTFLSIEALHFSPDGKELVGLFNFPPVTKLFAWSTDTREVTVDLSFDGRLISQASNLIHTSGETLQFLGSNGWLLYGCKVVERNSGRVVWQVGVADGARLLSGCIVADPNRLLCGVLRTNSSGRVEAISLPWDGIHRSLAEVNSDAPVHLRPGQKVSLDVRVSAARFSTPDDAREGLANLLTERLAQDGISVEDGQDTILEVQYREDAGQTLNEYAGQPGSGPLGRRHGNQVATGRKIQATRVTCAFKANAHK